MENDLVKIVVLPGKGTDIIEFVYKPLDMDFLWHSFNGLKNPADFAASCEQPGGSFLDLYEGGWQELFPNIGGPREYRGAQIGVHGEVCNLPWRFSIEEDAVEKIAVRFFVHTVRMPFYLEKKLTLALHDPCLYIEESITNESGTPQGFLWGHHPVFGPAFLDDACAIRVEGQNIAIHTADIAGCILKPNREFPWPVAEDKKGNPVDLSKISPPKSRGYMEYALHGLDRGVYSIYNTRMDLGFGMEWDLKVFPYVWVWEPNAASEGYPWYGRNYAVGIEPWTELPGAGEPAMQLHPQETLKTAIKAYAFQEHK